MECAESTEGYLASDFNNVNISAGQSESWKNVTEEISKRTGLVDPNPLSNGSGSVAKLYPHLYNTILQGQSSLLRENANQSLAALFPSVLTAEGLKNKIDTSQSSVLASTTNALTTLNPSTTSTTLTSSVAAELSQALSTALSLSASEAAVVGTVTAAGTDTLPSSEITVTQSSLGNTNTEKSDIVAKSTPVLTTCNMSTTSGTKKTNVSSSCAAGKKRKHQQVTDTNCAAGTTAYKANLNTSTGSSSSESTSSNLSGKGTTGPEIGPVCLGDALQQKIRETQAKIKSNVISASSSQSLLPPGKCTSHHNHQTGSKELNQLLHQHYCGKKAPKAPSASAVRKGKVPPQPGSTTTSPTKAASQTAPSNSTPGSSATLEKIENRDVDIRHEDCNR